MYQSQAEYWPILACIVIACTLSPVCATSDNYYVGNADRKCTRALDRCAGEAHHPFVKYATCCDKTHVCVTDKRRGWGRFCLPAGSTGGKCYKSGERCMGAAGYKYVHFHPCCDSSESCEEDAGKGWGSFCSPRKRTRGKRYKKCYATGARCTGARGKHYSEHRQCCEAGAHCVKDPSMGRGTFCTLPKEKYADSYAPPYGHYYPTPTSTQKKPYPAGYTPPKYTPEKYPGAHYPREYPTIPTMTTTTTTTPTTTTTATETTTATQTTTRCATQTTTTTSTESSTTVGQCSTTQVSGGQGTQVRNVDMLTTSGTFSL